MTKVSLPRHFQVIRAMFAAAGMRILVIEDEPRILSFLVRGLEAEGFQVEAAVHGGAALERARAIVPDLVVLDLLLPGVDGLTVLRELKRERPELPVVILSARSDLPTKLRGFELGASDYVAKPFALAELVARVRAQLRQSAWTGDANVVRAGALALDLSDREFKLLHHLVVHAGEVISRERLLEEVWGYHFDPRSNVVEVCVRRVRKKLGPEARIETVRHAGYRLVAA
jgi:two-component system, OmpR family, response regulator